MSKKLKHCPHCGREDAYVTCGEIDSSYGYYVKCSCCGAMGAIQTFDDADYFEIPEDKIEEVLTEAAINAWDLRRY